VRPTGRALLVAALVTSEREDGKPRQRTVAYLGSIGADAVAYVWRRQGFWEAARRKLDALGLGRPERKAVEQALSAVVAKPSRREVAAADREWRELTDALRGSIA
jgi:hypothetical protein